VIIWLSIVAFLLVIILWFNLYNSTVSLIFYVPISLIILTESRRQNLEVFFITQKLEKSLEDNEANAELHATELRHMIANVAHDLKTVSIFYYIIINSIIIISEF
jgi:hypothetical protein